MKKTLLLFAIFIFVFTLSFAARRTDEVFELPDDYGSKFQNNVKGDRSADFTIALTDDFGDGWNGGALDVFVNGSLVLDAITLSSGSGPENFTFTVEQDDSVFVDYTAGSWSSENAYYVYDNIGVLIASSGDGGVTPGDVSFFASPVDITTIYDIQYTTDPSGDSPYLGDVVTTTGIVTATDGNGTHFIQSGSGPWNGLYIHDYSHDYEVGHQVLIMGEVDEYYNKTELKDVSDLDTLATGVDIPPASEISTNEVNQEEYEGVLVSVSNATCVSDTNTYGEWEVDDGSGVCMIDDVFYGFDPEVDGTYYVTGPVDYSYGAFEILPRNAADIFEPYDEFAEDFDSVTEPDLPAHWSKIVNSTATSAKVETYDYYSAYTDPNVVNIYNHTDDTDGDIMLISPPVESAASGNTVVFYARSYASDHIMVGTITDPTDASTFTLVENVEISSSWTEYEVPVSITKASGYFAFKHPLESTYDNIYIDNVGWEIVPLEPEMILSEYSHDFGWVEEGEDQSWDFDITNDGGSTLFINSVDVSAPFSCTYPDSVVAGETATATVELDATTTSIYEDVLTLHTNATQDSTIELNAIIQGSEYVMQGFEEMDFPPQGWENINGYWSRYTNDAYEGDGYARTSWYTMYDAILMTPRLTINGDEFMHFYWRNANLYDGKGGKVIDGDTLYVEISDNWDDPMPDWEVLNVLAPEEEMDEYEPVAVNIPDSYIGNYARIRFRHHSIASDESKGVGLDNVVMPDTYEPVSFTVEPVYSSDYSAAGNSVEYEFEVTNTGIQTDKFYAEIDTSVTKYYINNGKAVEDFEADDGGYTHGGDNDDWEWGEPNYVDGPANAHSGSKLWGTNLTGEFQNNQLSYLNSTEVDLPSSNAYVSFWHWYDCGGGGWDGGNVKISTDGGSTWELIYPDAGYPTDELASSNPLSPEPGYNGGNSNVWTEAYFDLSDYAGESAIIRWHFGTTSVVEHPGWYIDDVDISGGGGPGPGPSAGWPASVSPSGLELAPGASGTFTLTVDIPEDVGLDEGQTKKVDMWSREDDNIAHSVEAQTTAHPKDPYEPNDLIATATAWVYGDSTEGAQIYYNSDYATKDIDIYEFTADEGDIVHCSFLLPPDETTFDGAINLVDSDSMSYAVADDYGAGASEELYYRIENADTYYLVLGKWSFVKEAPYKKDVSESDDKTFYTMKLEHIPSPGVAVFPDSINLGFISTKDVVTDQLEITNTGPEGAANLDYNIDIDISGYLELVYETFDNFPPNGWTTTGGSNWQGSNSNNAGGTAPEAEFYWSPSTTGMQRLITPVLNTTGYTELPLTFKHYVNDYSGGYTIGVATTSDGGTTWNDVWTLSPTGDVGPETINTTISTADVGSEDFQMCFYFDGNSFNVNWWNVDDVAISEGTKWAWADPASGSVPQGTTSEVDINADPSGLDDGRYSATINVHNNALLNGASDLQIPLYFYIGEESGGLEGTVTFAGTGDPIEDVHVTAGNFETYTDADGFYNLDPIALGTYDVVFEKDGFQTAYAYGIPLDPMYTVILDKALQFDGPPPRNLVANGRNQYVEIDWDKPNTGGGGGGQVDYILDDGTYENGWAINPGYESWLGNQFPVNDTGELISFEVYGDVNASAGSETVTIDVYDSDQNLVGTSDAFQIPAGGWTTVSAPNIPFDGEFYAMVHWDMLSQSTNWLGFDEDGPNATAGYDWYYDGSSWQLIHNAAGGSPGVFMIRATAEVSGKTVTFAYNQKKLGKEPDVNLKPVDNSNVANNGRVTEDVFAQSNKSGDTGNYETSHYSNLHMQENNKGKDFNILGYKIYEEEKGYVNYVEGENNTYYEDDVVAVGTEYTYWATAVYEQGEGGESNTDSAIPYISGGWHDDFTQNWSTTGKWSLDPASPNNWEYDGTNQCAKLTWSPSTTNYDMSLVSEEFTLPSDPADVFDLTVSMYINDYSTDSGEMMEIWIIHGGDETMVFQWDLDDNDDWGVSGGQDWVYSDTDQFAGETVQIKLRSHGGDTFNFNYWYVYDVLFDYAGTAPDYGALAGVVTDGDGTPIEGAEVKADVAKYNPVYTNEDGEYEIDPMKVGTYDVTYTATGYTTIVEEDVVIEADQTTTLDVVLGSPTMEIDPTTIDATVPVGGVDSTYITITNNGDAPLYWNATLENVDDSGISYNVNYNLTGSAAAPGVNDSRKGPGNGVYVPSHGEDMWDILYNFNDTDAGNPGIETNGEYIYTSDWRAGETTFHEFDMDGNFVQEFNISGATQIRDMAYDGEYFYGAAADMSLKKMDLPNQQLVETINASCSGVTGIRHIAFDPMLDGGNGGFWIGNWDGLGAIDKDGNQIYSNVGPGVGSLYGSAYDPITDGGPYLWLFSQEGSGVQLTQFEIASQSVTGVTHDANDIPGFISGSIAGGAATYITNDGLFALLVNIQQDPNLIGCYELGQVSTWIQIDPTTGTVDPGGSTQQVKVKFDAGEDPAGTVHTADVVFESPQGVPSVTTQVNLLVVPPTSGTLEGIVTDSDSNPIENATVTAGSYQATTNASGEYTIDDIATGTYDVYASHASYNTSAPATVEILEDQTTTQDFALTQPTMEVTPTTIEEFVHPDNPVSVDVTVANNGDGPLNYYVDLIRGVQTDYSNCSSGVPASEKGQIGSNNSDGFVAENTSKDDVTLHYDGPNDDNGIGLTDGGTFMVAARFTSDELDDYYGDYQLSNVEIFIWDTPTNATLKVWEGGSMGDPGTEIYSDDITSQVSQESWSTITLNTPIELIADNEYWVGYEVTHAAGDYPAGCDAGPAVDGKGDWIYLDPGPWDEIQNMGLDINWNIRAVLSPGMVPWITFSPDSGYVEAGDEDIVTVDFNTVDHSIGEVLVAQLHFSSMPDVGTQDVNIQVTVGDMEATGQTEVTETALNSSFPNPFTDHTTISFSLKQPTNVKLSVYNVKGQLVQTLLNEHMDKGEYNVDWNADNRRLGTGIYFYKLETENKSFLKKMIMIK